MLLILLLDKEHLLPEEECLPGGGVFVGRASTPDAGVAAGSGGLSDGGYVYSPHERDAWQQNLLYQM